MRRRGGPRASAHGLGDRAVFSPFAALGVLARAEVGAIGAATLAALALRLWGIGDLGDLDFDEQASFFIGSMPPAEMLAYLLRQPFEHPPLFYLLFHLWLGAVGGSEVAMRLFAVVPGVAAVPLVGAAAARVAGARAGAVAAWFLAAAPLHVYYSRDARMYSLLALMGAAALAGVAWGSLSPGGRVGRLPWLAAAGAGLAGLATHYYAAFALLGGAGALTRTPGARPWRPHARGVVWALGVAVGIGGLVWVGAASGLRTTLGTLQPRPVDPGVVAAALVSSLGGPLVGPLAPAGAVAVGAAVILGLLALSARAHRPGEIAFFRVALYGFLCPVVGIPLLLVLGRPFAPRYVALATPFLAALVGLAAARLPRRWLVVGAAIVLAVAGSGLAPIYNGHIRSDYGRAMWALRAEARPDDILVLNGPWQDLLFRRYGAGLPPHTFVASRVPLDPAETLPQLATLVAEHPRVWVVDSATDAADPDGVVAGWLDRHAYPRPVIPFEKALLRPYLTDVGRPLAMEERLVSESALGVRIERVAADAWRLPPGGEARLQVWGSRLSCEAADVPCGSEGERRALIRLLAADGKTVWHWDGRLWPAGAGLEYRAGLAIPRDAATGRYALEAVVYEAVDGERGGRQIVRISAPISLGAVEVVAEDRRVP